jgi:hypothetical protein
MYDAHATLDGVTCTGNSASAAGGGAISTMSPRYISEGRGSVLLITGRSNISHNQASQFNGGAVRAASLGASSPRLHLTLSAMVLI